MKKMTTRRKLAIATWATPREGNIYGKLTVDATAALAHLAAVREQTGRKVTLTHFVGKAVALALAQTPSLNGYLRFGRYIPHDDVAVAFLVVVGDGADLAKVKVAGAHQKSLVELADELGAAAGAVRAGKDDAFEKSKGLLRALPTWVLRPIVWLTGWLTASLGLRFPPAGLEPFPFGACVITSVGMFGLDEAFVPPTPFARVPVYILIGAAAEQPAVVDGALTVRTRLTITATIDHRFLDGFQGGQLAKMVRRVFAEPHLVDAPPDA